MSEIQLTPDDWGSANNRQSFQRKTLHITKENKSIYLTVVWMLGLTVFFSMGGIVGLSFLSKRCTTSIDCAGVCCCGCAWKSIYTFEIK